MNPFIRLITHSYDEQDPIRRTEIVEAMRQQADDPLIDSKVYVREQDGRRPTFAELVGHGTDDTHVVNLLVNTDCFVDPADMPLLDAIEANEVWCISREDNCRACSQDAWAWRGKLEVLEATFTQGVLGCDNAFAFYCAAAGRTPINPALSIHIHHLHASGKRTWTERERAPLPYLFVEPTKIGEQSRLEFRGTPADRQRIERMAGLLAELGV